jgi:hypothetical protein
MKITLLTWISLAIMAMTLNLGHAFMTPPSNHHALVVPQSVFRPTYEYSRDQGSPYSRDQVCVSFKTVDEIVKRFEKINTFDAAKKFYKELKEKVFDKTLRGFAVVNEARSSVLKKVKQRFPGADKS